MAFKTVVSLDADTVIALGGKDKKTGKPNPKQVEGYYLGKREVSGGKYEKTATIYYFQTPEGNLGVWGKTDLNRKMGSVAQGTMVRATHTGMTPTPNGEMHTYRVEFDPENTIEVDFPSNAVAAAGRGPEEESEGYSNGTEDEEQGEEQEELRSSALQRKSAVQSLLGRKTASK